MVSDPPVVAASVAAAARRLERIVGVVIRLGRENELLEVVRALHTSRRFTRRLNRRQKKTDKNTDDRDNDQKLDKGETFRVPPF